MSIKKSSAILFCDFDGTITERSTFIEFVQQNASPSSNEIIQKILTKQIPLRIGIRQVVENFSSSTYSEVLLKFIRGQPIRPGLSTLIDYLDSRGIPFIVISSGIRHLIEAVLKRENLLERCTKIYACDVDVSQEKIKMISEWEGDDELISKVDVIKSVCCNNEKIIFIGDSLTDLNAAKHADIVFARDRLCHYLTEDNIEFIEWTDFNDVKTKLQSIESRFLPLTS